MKTKPANCDILTADYSFKEMMDILSGDEYKGKIGNIIVLGGVPLYNTMMAKISNINPGETQNIYFLSPTWITFFGEIT